MTKLSILFTYLNAETDIPSDLPNFEQFKQDFDVQFEQITTASSFQNALLTKHKNISAIWETSAILQIGGLNQFIDYLPKSLKIIAFPWVGADCFDVERLRAKGITLANIGDISSYDVADIALSLTLGVFRFTSFMESSLRNLGNVQKTKRFIGSDKLDSKGQPIYEDDSIRKNEWPLNITIGGKRLESPRGKVAGLVGLGSIGKEIAKRLSCIGMEIKYTKRTPLTSSQLEEFPFELEYFNSFQELIPQIDLLVLAVPQTPDTINLINSESIKLFKKGVRIVNVGRGSAIDEDVLLRALDDGTITSVGLDVFKTEPLVDERFLNRPDVTILPHLGSFTCDTSVNTSIRTMENIKDVLIDGGSGISVVN